MGRSRRPRARGPAAPPTRAAAARRPAWPAGSGWEEVSGNAELHPGRTVQGIRYTLALIFGLIHGLGFAGFFGELGLPPGQFWSALIGFNVGVEIGQLSVILVAAIVAYAVRRWLRDPAGVARYRSWIVRPGAALIGLTGLWWGFARLSGLG